MKARKEHGTGQKRRNTGRTQLKAPEMETIHSYESSDGKHSVAIGFVAGKLMLQKDDALHPITLRESVRWNANMSKVCDSLMIEPGGWNYGAQKKWLTMIASVMVDLPRSLERRFGHFCQRYHINPQKFMAHAMECALNGADDDLRSIVKECGE